MKQKIVPIILVSSILGLLFDLLFDGKAPGISVVIYSSLVLGATLYLANLYKQRVSRSLYMVSPAILFFSVMVFMRASSFLAVFNILLSMYLFTVVFRLVRHPVKKLSDYQVLSYFNLFGQSVTTLLQELYESLQHLVQRRQKAQKAAYAPVVRGAAISLPILLIFLLLLSAADLVFKRLVSAVFDFNVAPETIFRGLVVALVASIFFAAYVLLFARSSSVEPSAVQNKRTFRLGATEASTVLGSVGVLFLIFVIIQFAYLFGGADQIASNGYTYAEYARKGFFELIAVAAISLLLVWALKRLVFAHSARQAVTFKGLSALLIVEVMVIMLSAHIRLNLYEAAYGFTALRLVSHLFIGWLGVAFILLGIYILREEREQQFAFRIFWSVIAFFAVLNLINPEAFIARQNMNRFNDTGKLDVTYLSSLSADAVPAVAGFLDHPNKKVQRSAADILHQEKQAMSQSPHWQSFNLSKQRADSLFKEQALD